ncbi:MAG: efflux transporter outer membrane subunit [Elusimicrobiota bacterium]|nr:efflux transporter outer membrane subunit [Elusimicrobiota bacterium]
MAPKYKTPDTPVARTWGNEDMYTSETEFTAQELDLENFIKDKRILAVINMALSGNRDLRGQLADVEAARALYKVERSKLLPSIYAGGSGGESKSANGAHVESYSAEIGLSAFEIDLFGKNRSLNDSKLQQYLASENAAQSAKISLIAETSLAWITLASDKEMLKIARDTVKSAQESADIAKRRFEAGVTSQLDLYQAQTILHQAKSDVADYTAIVAQDINALELLAGGKIPAELLPENLEKAGEWFGNVSVGLSSEVLFRRPDVRAAEHTLRSANADIGAARAAFFPAISLIAATGLASADLSKLFSDGSSVWSYSGNLNIPIFSAGRNIANLKYSKAKYQSYLAQYDKAVQTAFKEVKDALARRATIYAQIEAQTDLLFTSKQGYNLARMRYDKGIETYLNVLEQQRTFYNAAKSMISAALTEINNRIILYKALGGGSEKNIANNKK